jgi:hypothetical protein
MSLLCAKKSSLSDPTKFQYDENIDHMAVTIEGTSNHGNPFLWDTANAAKQKKEQERDNRQKAKKRSPKRNPEHQPRHCSLVGRSM